MLISQVYRNHAAGILPAVFFWVGAFMAGTTELCVEFKRNDSQSLF